MKKIKTLLLITFLFATIINAQYVVTPSTAISSFSQPHWKMDTDLNDHFTVVTYGNQNPSTSAGSTGTFLKVYDNTNTAITADINILNIGFTVTRVKISNDNNIYVLGVNDYGAVSKLVLRKYNTSGTYLGNIIINHSIGGNMFDLALADNGDVLVSLFEGDNLKIRSYNSALSYKGVINVASGITHYSPGSGQLRSQFMDFNDGKILIGYSRGYDASLISHIKKYNYNSFTPASSIISGTHSFHGGFKRFDIALNNSHQIALRSNGDIFYVDGTSGIRRVSGGNTYLMNPNTKAKVNVDANDNVLFSWTDTTSAKARLYSASNSLLHNYSEDGNINGSWATAFYDCKFIIVGDKSNQGADFHTNRKPYGQFFNCSNCEAGGVASADFDFRYPNAVVSLPSYYGPQDVTELCLIDNLFVDGTDSCNEDGYYVSIAEFDLDTWTDTVVLHSAWVCTGCTAPNNIDIASFLPAGYQLRPNKIYRFKLAVGSPWHSESKFFRIACCEREIILVDDYDEIKLPAENIIEEEDNNDEMNEVDLDISIYPNPAQDEVIIDLSNVDFSNTVNIDIKDVYGITQYTTKAEEKQLKIDISKWKTGIYICIVTMDEKEISMKIIKE